MPKQGVSDAEIPFFRSLLGLEGLNDAPRSGRPCTIGPEKIAQLVHKTIQDTPCDSTHRSTRSLAQEAEVSASSVSRIWRHHKLQQHRANTFNLTSCPLCPDRAPV